MTTITFIKNCKGKPVELVVETSGLGSVMQVAVDNLVPGVEATCGGCCSCATCHAFISDDWISKLPPPSEDELSLLEGLDNYLPNSRLLCQIAVSEKISGIVATIPAGST